MRIIEHAQACARFQASKLSRHPGKEIHLGTHNQFHAHWLLMLIPQVQMMGGTLKTKKDLLMLHTPLFLFQALPRAAFLVLLWIPRDSKRDDMSPRDHGFQKGTTVTRIPRDSKTDKNSDPMDPEGSLSP